MEQRNDLAAGPRLKQQANSQPHAIEAEQAIIGTLLLDPNATPEALRLLRSPEAFHDARHQTIFRQLTTSADFGLPQDPMAIIQQLRDAGQEQAAGGATYCLELLNLAHSAASLPWYCETVIEKARLRLMLAACLDGADRIQHHHDEADDTLSHIERSVLAVRQASIASRTTTRQLVQDCLADMDQRYGQHGSISGVSTGYPDLDHMTDGLQPGEMTVMAAFPGTGKTALAINIIEHISINLQLPTAIFSLEMSARSLMHRLLCSRCRIDARDISRGTLSQQDFHRLSTTASQLQQAPITIEESSDLSIFELRAMARQIARNSGCRLFVVDYLQLLSASGGTRKVESRQQEVTDISRGLKAMARELACPVIALSQLNDDGKLRESRAIGQDADCIWKLRNTEEPDPNNPATGANRPVTLAIEKQRNGPSPATIQLIFHPHFTRFESCARPSNL